MQRFLRRRPGGLWVEENGKQELHQAIFKFQISFCFSYILSIESNCRTHLGDGNVQKICLMPTFGLVSRTGFLMPTFGLVSQIGSTTMRWNRNWHFFRCSGFCSIRTYLDKHFGEISPSIVNQYNWAGLLDVKRWKRALKDRVDSVQKRNAQNRFCWMNWGRVINESERSHRVASSCDREIRPRASFFSDSARYGWAERPSLNPWWKHLYIGGGV